MTTTKKIQMVLRDMLFITWSVQPEIARKMVDKRLELDTRPDADGREVAFVSAVCFHVSEVRSAALPVPRLSFEQVNYRVYVKAGEVPAVCFLDMKVNSRMVTAMTSFLSVPIYYEDIEITTSAGESGLVSYAMRSTGLCATAAVNGRPDLEPAPAGRVTPDFITQRYVGFMGAGNGMFKIDVEQPGLKAVPASSNNVQAPRLEQIGLLTRDQWDRPFSVLYVREALFGADTPVREW